MAGSVCAVSGSPAIMFMNQAIEFALTARERLIIPTKIQFWRRLHAKLRRVEALRLGILWCSHRRQSSIFPCHRCRRLSTTAFPAGTLIINATGSMILGFFVVWTTRARSGGPALAIACCHRFLRFLHHILQLAFETIAYFEQGNWMLFAGNILANNVLCLGAVLLGGMLARSL